MTYNMTKMRKEKRGGVERKRERERERKIMVFSIQRINTKTKYQKFIISFALLRCCFDMVRSIICVRCDKSLNYQHYKSHLTTCKGVGRFCPICCKEIELEGTELAHHLLQCQRKWFVSLSLLYFQSYFNFLFNLYIYFKSFYLSFIIM